MTTLFCSHLRFDKVLQRLCVQTSQIQVAGAEGLEPPTIGFGDRCSTNWNYAPALLKF